MSRRALFFAALGVIALLTRTEPGSAHSMSRLGTVESIVDRHTLQLDDSIFIGTVDKIYKDGHFYSHQPPLLSVLEAPVYGLLRVPGTRFNNRGRPAMVYAFTLLTNGLALALTVVVLGEIFAMAGVASPMRQWMALMLPFGTWLLPYGIVTNNHGVSGLLTALLIWLLLKIEWHGAAARRAFGIGLTLGLLVAIEVLPIAAFVPATIVYLWSRRVDARSWAMFTAGLAAPLAAHAAINIPLFGDIIPAGFHAELFQYEGSVFDAASLTGTLKYSSVGAAANYAWQALFVEKGYFTFAPICLLGFVTSVISWRWWLSRAAGPYAVMLSGVVISLLGITLSILVLLVRL